MKTVEVIKEGMFLELFDEAQSGKGFIGYNIESRQTLLLTCNQGHEYGATGVTGERDGKLFLLRVDQPSCCPMCNRPKSAKLINLKTVASDKWVSQ